MSDFNHLRVIVFKADSRVMERQIFVRLPKGFGRHWHDIRRVLDAFYPEFAARRRSATIIPEDVYLREAKLTAQDDRRTDAFISFDDPSK